MKKLLIGLLALGSVTAFATEVEFHCDIDGFLKNKKVSSSTISGGIELPKEEVAKSVSLQTSFDEVITFELQRVVIREDTTFRIIRAKNNSVLSATNLNTAEQSFTSSFNYSDPFSPKKTSGTCKVINLNN
jgi:hypothetical protein